MILPNGKKEKTFLSTTNALGNGIMNDVYDVVYVKKGAFDPSKNILIAYDIEKINKQLVAEDKSYILVGPGRWGSSDHWLGIPIKWPHISGARVIVEAGETSYHIDPSQGTHFFQNLTSFGVCYFTITQNEDDYYDCAYLDEQEALHETEYIRHVRFSSPLLVKVDGRKNRGVVLRGDS